MSLDPLFILRKQGEERERKLQMVQRFSDHGPWTGSTNTVWALVGKADFQASPKTY